MSPRTAESRRQQLEMYFNIRNYFYIRHVREAEKSIQIESIKKSKTASEKWLWRFIKIQIE